MTITLFRDLPTEGWPSMERYADELTAALKDLGADAQPFVAPRPGSTLNGRSAALANYAWRSLVYPWAARRHQGRLNHILDHSYAHLLNSLDPRRTIVTCHDLAPLAIDRGSRGLSRRLWEHSFRAMLRAAHIIADSHHTRDEILRHSDYPAGRVTVVPLAVNPAFFKAGVKAGVQVLLKRPRLLDRPLILHVGSCQPRKNLEVLLQAMSELRALDPVLVQIGGQFTPTQQALTQSLKLGERVFQFRGLDESELRLWYQSADVFAFPSLYEGFGLPVLEAMAGGAPVVCSNATSVPEVAGDAAILVEPQSASGLALALHAVLTDKALRDELIHKGLERSRQFTWEQTAQQTMEVYALVERSLTA
jgi:glycosyltransferase involved in cell wall biosynthesis